MPYQLNDDQPVADVHGINLKPGSGMTVTSSLNTREQRVDWTIAQAAANGGVMTLAANSSVGASTITSAVLPPSGLGTSATYIAIGVGLSTCEVRAVTSISGATLTLSSTLANAHSSGEWIALLPSLSVPVTFWGAKPGTDGFHTNIQAAINETSRVGVALDGMGKQFLAIPQPLVFRSSAWLKNFNVQASSWTGPTDTGGTCFMGYSSQGSIVTFTAAAATDTITTASAHGIPSDATLVVFQALGASFPAGLTEGKLYYVGNRTANTFKVYTDVGLTALVDITGDGAGTVYCEVLSLAKLSCDWMYFHTSNVAGLGGLYLNLQQQSRLNDLRVGSSITPVDATVLLHVKGQQAEFYDLEVISGATGLLIDGGGKFFDFYGSNIEGQGVAGIALDSAFSCGFFGLHMEPGAGGMPIYVDIRSGGCQAISFHRVRGAVSALKTGVKVNSSSSSLAEFTIMDWDSLGGGSTGKLVDDIIRGFSFTLADLPGGASGQYLLPLYSQVQQGNAPLLGWRGLATKTTTYAATILDETLLGDTTAGGFTITLPTPVGITGKRYTLKRSAGANVLTIATAAATFDGSATIAVTTAVTYVSNGTIWTIV